MSDWKKINVTVKRNWKKKILALCAGNPVVTSYSLPNNFIGHEFTPEDMLAFVEKENDNYRGSNLTYNKETGVCTLHVHSNLWYTWTNKIDW